MSQAHYEAVRLSSSRPFTSGSKRSFLPFGMRRTETSPNIKVSHRFSHPNEEVAQQVTHEHVLILGNRILAQMERNTDRRIQQTSQQLMTVERKRLESEYQEKSEELIRKWKAQVEEQKLQLQKEIDKALAEMERQRQDYKHQEEEAIMRRMREECNQALAKQWKLATEKLALAVKQAEDRLKGLLELKHLEEKERYTTELIAKKDAEYAERESNALAKIKAQLTNEHNQNIEVIREKHAREIEELTSKLKLSEERFRREFTTRARLESDFRLLQTDYKRFMDNSNVFHSDYMLKLCHIGEQIGDTKFEQVLDRILAETNIQHVPIIKNHSNKSKHSLK